MDILEKLRSLNEPVPVPPELATEEDVKNAEEKLGVQFPPSYIKYQLEYADVSYANYELYQLAEDGSDLDLVEEVKAARQHHELPGHLLPFVADQDGDYYCFDLSSQGPEYEVIYWSHNGIADEKWDNFLDWVERCWIGENADNS